MALRYCWRVGLLLILAACGGVGESATPQAPLTLSPLPSIIIQGQCEVTIDLESWLQVSEFSRLEFLDLVDEASSKSRQRIYADAERMGQILMNVSTRPTPDCAEEAQKLLIDVMLTTVVQFQAYVNGDRDDLAQIIAQARVNFDAIEQERAVLMERLNEQYQMSSQ